MAPGARSKFDVLVFEPDLFRKEFTVLKKILVAFFVTFRCQHSDSAPRKLCPPIPPSLRLWQ